MMNNYREVANDPILWLTAVPLVAMVAVQAVLICRRAVIARPLVQMSGTEVRLALRAGAISAIGPAVAVFIVMLGMIAVVGGPMTWLRLSVIGAAPTELTAATMGATAMGVELGSERYDAAAFAASAWVMTLNGMGWLLFAGLFTHRLHALRHKVAGGNTALMGHIGGAAMLGTMAYLTGGHLLAGGGRLVAAIAAGVAMAVLVKVVDRVPALREYSLGIAMIVGMFAAVLAS
ncbi:MAG: DUF5058 family protein [Vicinamibacterales bacterium]